MSGTLEGKGPNKVGTTDAACRDYSYNGIASNATTSPPLRGSVESNGPNKAGDKGASLVNAVDGNADTSMYPFPEGTFTGEGING